MEILFIILLLVVCWAIVSESAQQSTTSSPVVEEKEKITQISGEEIKELEYKLESAVKDYIAEYKTKHNLPNGIDVINEAAARRYEIIKLGDSNKHAIIACGDFEYHCLNDITRYVNHRFRDKHGYGLHENLNKLYKEHLLAGIEKPERFVSKSAEGDSATYFSNVQNSYSEPKTTKNIFEAMFDSYDDAKEMADEIRERELAAKYKEQKDVHVSNFMLAKI